MLSQDSLAAHSASAAADWQHQRLAASGGGIVPVLVSMSVPTAGEGNFSMRAPVTGSGAGAGAGVNVRASYESSAASTLGAATHDSSLGHPRSAAALGGSKYSDLGDVSADKSADIIALDESIAHAEETGYGGEEVEQARRLRRQLAASEAGEPLSAAAAPSSPLRTEDLNFSQKIDLTAIDLTLRTNEFTAKLQKEQAFSELGVQPALRRGGRTPPHSPQRTSSSHLRRVDSGANRSLGAFSTAGLNGSAQGASAKRAAALGMESWRGGPGAMAAHVDATRAARGVVLDDSSGELSGLDDKVFALSGGGKYDQLSMHYEASQFPGLEYVARSPTQPERSSPGSPAAAPASPAAILMAGTLPGLDYLANFPGGFYLGEAPKGKGAAAAAAQPQVAGLLSSNWTSDELLEASFEHVSSPSRPPGIEV